MRIMTTVLLSKLSQQLQTLFDIDVDYEAGFALGRHILRHWPHHLQTYAQMGIAALGVGLYADASDILQRALSADPEAGVLWAGFRQVSAALGQEEEVAIAQAYEQEMLSSAQGDSRGLIGEAMQAAKQKNWQQAVRAYQRLYAAQPARMDIVLGYATSLYRLERFEACLAVTQRVLEELPFSLKAHWLRVRCAYSSTLGSIDVYAHVKTIDALDPDYIYARRWFPDLEAPSSAATCPAWDAAERWSHM